MLTISLTAFLASWDENAWIANSMSSAKFFLKLDISYDLFIGKCVCAIYPSYLII